MEPRFDIRIMGCLLGTATGWDGEMPTYAYYGFIPDETNKDMHEGDLQIDYEKGSAEIINEAGDITHTYNLVPILWKLLQA